MDLIYEIPKTIHYCWFGGKPLGAEELRCIESWKKYLPEYEIKRWDESNFDVCCCDYVSEAYRAKKWAFVSDYARFEILYRCGGLYFDTDVELIRAIDDLIAMGPFMGFELDFNKGEAGTVNPGLGLSAVPRLALYKEILDSYQEDHFLNNDGSLNLKTVVTRTTEILDLHGLIHQPGIQDVDGITIYPAEFFNPKDFWTGEIHLSDKTRTIHHFGMSWYTDEDKYRYELEKNFLKKFPNGKLAHRLAVIATMVRYRDLSAVKGFIKRLGE